MTADRGKSSHKLNKLKKCIKKTKGTEVKSLISSFLLQKINKSYHKTFTKVVLVLVICIKDDGWTDIMTVSDMRTLKASYVNSCHHKNVNELSQSQTSEPSWWNVKQGIRGSSGSTCAFEAFRFLQQNNMICRVKSAKMFSLFVS